MTTPQQLLANRANARLSLGPKTRAGKWRAARNARRHGLSTSIWSDPGLAADAEAVALELAGSAAGQELKGLARIAAAAHIDVDRICRMRHQLITQGMNNAHLGPTTGRAAERHTRDFIQLFELLSERLYIPWTLRSHLMPLEEPEKFAVAISNLARQLGVLERYERRALSRRKKAFRRFRQRATQSSISRKLERHAEQSDNVRQGNVMRIWPNEPKFCQSYQLDENGGGSRRAAEKAATDNSTAVANDRNCRGQCRHGAGRVASGCLYARIETPLKCALEVL